jgi:hypothetical protein
MTLKLSDLNMYDIGNKIGIVGAIFGDADAHYVVLFPDQEVLPFEYLQMNRDDWKKFLRQVDLCEVEVLTKNEHGDLTKMVLRKSQRFIEQRVSWAVFRRDGYKCRYCGKEGIPLTVDHLVTWESGGPSIEANLLAACRKCNKTRGDMEYKDWLKHPHYLQVSAKLSPFAREENERLAATLDRIPRNHSTRETRK